MGAPAHSLLGHFRSPKLVAHELTALTTTGLCFPDLGRTHVPPDPLLNPTFRAWIGASSSVDRSLWPPLQVSGTSTHSACDHSITF